MLPSEKDAVHIWLSLIETMPSSVMTTLRKIKGGTATVVTCERSITREPFTAAMCYNADKLTTYLLHEFGCSANELPTQAPDDITLLNLGMRLEQMLHSHSNAEEAPGLYSVLMEGPIPKGLRRNEEKPRRYITELRAEHIWRSMLRYEPAIVKELLSAICSGGAQIRRSEKFDGMAVFTTADVYNDGKLDYLLAGIHELPDVEELILRYPAGEVGDFRRELTSFLDQHCTDEQSQKFHRLFFGRARDELEKEVVKPTPDIADLVEMVPSTLNKVFNDFIENGKRLGIPVTTLAILLPDATRKQIQLEIFEQMSK